VDAKSVGIKPASWLLTLILFGVPGLAFALLFHWVGPTLLQHGVSWWGIFHLVLIVPLALMLIAALIGAARDVRSLSIGKLSLRLRLSPPVWTSWLWAIALSGFMYGGSSADAVAIAAAWLALWKEKTKGKWLYAGVPTAVLIDRSAGYLQPTLSFVRFFHPSPFFLQFFSHFGPRDFMGIPLLGSWWIPVYYATLMLIFNIGGEELWWRGYVLPRQELAFGKLAWVVHGIFWSGFHLFMQPTLWDTFRMAISGVALSYVAQRTKSTWPSIVGHSCGNLPFFLSLMHGVTTR
jgi:membrane protease YdiL (CAAX protease family)